MRPTPSPVRELTLAATLSRGAGEGLVAPAVTTLSRTAGEGGPLAQRAVGEGQS
jgi:hypothetical protein